MKEEFHYTADQGFNGEMDAFALEYKERLGTIEGKLSDINHRLDRLYDALERGRLSLNDLAPQIQMLRQTQDQLQVAQDEIEELLS